MKWLTSLGSSWSRAGVIAAVIALLWSCTMTTTPSVERGSIQHVVIIVKENHSFDNYFGSLEDPTVSLPHCPSTTSQARCQYNRTDIPAYYQYARNFGYADRYFTDVRGPSWPNDMMMIAGQSPLESDPSPPLSSWVCPAICYELPTIGDRLTEANVTWRNYGEDLYDPFRSIRHYAADHEHNVGLEDLYADLNSPNLPAVAWIRPAPEVSEHPGFDVRTGEQWTVDIINRIMRSRYWYTTAIFVTWDDAGDVLDHVVPPTIERSPTGAAIRYGLRVPLIVISPFTPTGIVSHQLMSHVSLLKFIEGLFHIEPLTFRDANANSPSEFFDVSAKPRGPLTL